MKPSTGIEKALIGYALMYPDDFPELVREVRAEIFYHDEHRRAWEKMAESYREGVLPTAEVMQERLGWKLIAECMKQAAPYAAVKGYIKSLETKLDARRLQMLSARLAGIAQGEGDFASKAQAEFRDYLAGMPSTGSSMAITRLIESAHAYASQEEGLTTGLHSLDDEVGRMDPGTLCFLYGLPGHGKTLVALAMAVRQAKAGIPAGFLSLEMAPPPLGLRVASSETGLRRGELVYRAKNPDKPGDPWGVLKGKLKSLPLWFGFDVRDVDDLCRRALQWKDQHNLGVLYVDHLQEVGARGKDGVAAMDYIVDALKDLALKTGLCVVILGQYNRQFIKQLREKQDAYFDSMRGSSRIEQSADRILFLLKPEEEKEEATSWKRSAQVHLLIRCVKNRNGKLGQVGIELDYETQSVKEGDVVPF